MIAATPPVKISASYTFEAAHRLPKLPPEHKCHRLHGHNYKLDVIVSGELDARGFVMDFAELDDVVAPLVAIVDHRYLNEIDGLDNPTAEVIALWFRERIAAKIGKRHVTVRLWETPRYSVEVS